MSDEANWIDLSEREDRQAKLAEAKRRAHRVMMRAGPERSWIISREQSKRFIASGNPLRDYPEEAEYWIASFYNDQFPWTLHSYYSEHFGRTPRRWQDTRAWWERLLMGDLKRFSPRPA